MNWFLVVGVLLLIVIVIVLITPLLRKDTDQISQSAGIGELNLGVLRDQQAELEKDFAENGIDRLTYEQSRQELERRTLDDANVLSAKVNTGARKFKFALAFAVIFPLSVFSLYGFLGTPEAVTGKAVVRGGAPGEHALSPDQILVMAEKLALRLQENPADGEGWLMLGRSYAVLGRYPESVAAYSRAMILLPPEAQRYADFADIAAMAQGKRLEGEPEKLVNKALELDPANIKALALAGTIAFDRQDYTRAISQWRKVQSLVPEDSAVAAGIQGSIQDAENRMAIAAKSDVAKPGVPSATESAIKVSGIVELDPSLKSKIAAGDSLFIFARAVNGPKMPVAMLRKKVEDLPLKFYLDDTMSMSPQFKLSTAGQIVVGARISKSGDALPRAGDIEGISQQIAPGAVNVRVVISNIVN
jgi:cytochrome c-type biogenesis protein CcmH